MLPSELLAKPLHEWTLDDLTLIVERQSEESQFLEFKEYMPLNRGSQGWNSGGALHANERDGLAKEIVAFANAYGGHLIVGIKETKEKPSRAEKLGDGNTNVAELAERLRSALNSIIDPPINGLEIQPIISNETGGGFVVVHVPQSIHAPHGFGKPPEAYVRRADRSEPMTMRDMQSVFWEARTRRERIDAEIVNFSNDFNDYAVEANRLAFGFVAVSENREELGGLLEHFKNRRANSSSAASLADLYETGSFDSCIDAPTNLQKWFPYSRGVKYKTSNRANFDGNVQEGTWSVDDSGVICFIGNKQGYEPKEGTSYGGVAGDPQILFDQRELIAALKQFLDLVRFVSKAKPAGVQKWVVKGVFRTAVSPVFVPSDVTGYRQVNLKGGVEFRPITVDFDSLGVWPDYLSKRVWESFETGAPENQVGYLGGILNEHWSRW